MNLKYYVKEKKKIVEKQFKYTVKIYEYLYTKFELNCFSI